MKKIFNLGLLLIAITISAFTLNVKAAGTVTWNGTNKVTIKRIIEKVNNAPTVTYTYAVTPSTSNPTGSTGAPTTATVAFSGNETVSNHKVEKTTELSFANMAFTLPGNYTYTITESTSNNNAYPKDSTSTYTVVLSVRNVVDAQGAPTGNFTAALVLKNSSGTKIEGQGSNPPIAEFKSSPDSSKFSDITITKSIKGNAADVNESFAFTITLDETSGTYPIVVTHSDNTKNTYTLTNGSHTLNLKHGDTVTVGKVEYSTGNYFSAIPVGTKVGISENKKDYTATYSLNGGSSTTGNSFSNQTLAETGLTADFVNTKDSSADTGIITTIIPYILLVVASVIGTLTYINIKSKPKKEKIETL